MVPPRPESDTSRQTAEAIKRQFADCLEKDEQGRLKLTVTLPDPSALDHLADSIARPFGQRG